MSKRIGIHDKKKAKEELDIKEKEENQVEMN